MKVHFIAIGGSVMHNLALALHYKNISVTGSDDEIFEPAYSRLKNAGLLPDSFGWDQNKVTADIDAIVLGMHARADNPELLKAKELNIPVFSFPEYIFNQSQNKTRVVIAGSHGKTSTTAMIMHVLKCCGKNFDYMVGAQLEGFDLMVKLSDAPVIILEGDEYPDSALNKTPKFLFYKANIGLITGIAWDHVNIFPTYEGYVNQFEKFIDSIEPNGDLIYNEEDSEVKKLVNKKLSTTTWIPYSTPPNKIINGKTIIQIISEDVELNVFGKHNLQNLAGAMLVCEKLGITKSEFANAISSFGGAAKRLEKIKDTNSLIAFRDFAHSPSKLKATIQAVANQYEGRKLIAVFELHTFSSLSKEFLAEYKHAMNAASQQIVFYNQHSLELKKLPPLDPDFVLSNFEGTNMKVITDKLKLETEIKNSLSYPCVLLLMSSGNFDGLDINSIINSPLKKK